MNLTLEEIYAGFKEQGYITNRDVILTVFLALSLEKPLLIEGEPGVGKTELAKTLSRIFKTLLIRLQCYEGLDETKALYEWNYQRQLLKIQMNKDCSGNELESDLFSPEYLLARPLLRAIQSENKPVLLIDEVDKTDQEFEAFLFELLSDFTVSIPELGTITATHIPIVVLTSNNERELSDGLKRRCIYLYLDFPDVEREIEIIRSHIPGIGERLSQQVAMAVAHIRANQEIRKKPSIAETLDWSRALVALDADRLEPQLVKDTLNLLLKNRADQLLFNRQVGAEALAELVRKG